MMQLGLDTIIFILMLCLIGTGVIGWLFSLMKLGSKSITINKALQVLPKEEISSEDTEYRFYLRVNKISYILVIVATMIELFFWTFFFIYK